MFYNPQESVAKFLQDMSEVVTVEPPTMTVDTQADSISIVKQPPRQIMVNTDVAVVDVQVTSFTIVYSSTRCCLPTPFLDCQRSKKAAEVCCVGFFATKDVARLF